MKALSVDGGGGRLAWLVVAMLAAGPVAAAPTADKEEAGLDAQTRRELRRARLWGEFEMLKDTRHDLFDVYMASEGEHFTVSLPFLVRFSEDDVPGVVPRLPGRLGRRLREAASPVLRDETAPEVPALHLAVGDEEDPFFFDIANVDAVATQAIEERPVSCGYTLRADGRGGAARASRHASR